MPKAKSYRCLNCSAPAAESFCPRCGQATRERRAPLLTLFREMLDYFSLDRTLPRSLFELLLRPGNLTRLYLAGKRASYVPPLRMYLVISLLFVVMVQITPPDVSEVEVYVGGERVGPARSPSAAGARLQTSIQILPPQEDAGWLNTQIEKHLLAGKRERFRRMDPQELVNRIFRGVQRHAKLGLFVFLPLLALALKLLFLRSAHFYFDHLIFALHFQAFLFLALSAARVTRSSMVFAVTGAVLCPLYLLLALRRVYDQPWRWILPKCLALGLSYFLLLGLVFALVMLVVLRSI